MKIYKLKDSKLNGGYLEEVGLEKLQTLLYDLIMDYVAGSKSISREDVAKELGRELTKEFESELIELRNEWMAIGGSKREIKRGDELIQEFVLQNMNREGGQI